MWKFRHARTESVLIIAGWFLPVLAGVVLASIDGKRDWFNGAAAYSLLLLASSLMIGFFCKRLNACGWITILSHALFWLRLVTAVGFMGLLPILGYQDSVVSQAGYIFQDAYVRDEQAWDLASSNLPIISAFTGVYSGDQYGGMLGLSAATYRYLSPESHRPFLVLIWISLAGALSALVLWHFTTEWIEHSRPDIRFTVRAAFLIFAFYPEAFLLGSSHMREPVVMLGITLLMEGYIRITRHHPRGFIWLIAGSSILLFFQVTLAVVIFAILLGLYLLEPANRSRWKFVILLALLMMAALAGSFVVFSELPSLANASPAEIFQTWLARNFSFQAHLSERSSGMLQKLLDSGGKRFTIPIVIGYGALQPVLPAALVDPAAFIWRVINVLRAAGWYLLAPVLMYSILDTVKMKFSERRWQRLLLGMVSLAWIVISAVNAGGDQWDNPRYRSLFLPWMVVLAAWGWSWARQQRDPWLLRFLIVSGVFSSFFLEWYLSRYIPLLPHLDIRLMILLTVSVIAVYLLGCLVWDFHQRNET